MYKFKYNRKYNETYIYILSKLNQSKYKNVHKSKKKQRST